MRNFLFFSSIFLLLAKVNAQSISPTTGATCSTCVPTGWTLAFGTTDISNTTHWSGNTVSWALWINAPTAVPVSGATTFISGYTNERAQTTITGLTSGIEYDVTFYAAELVSRAGGSIVGGSDVLSYDGVLEITDGAGTVLHTHAYSGGNSPTWDLVTFTFTASGSTQVLNLGYETPGGFNGNSWNASIAADAVTETCKAGTTAPSLSDTLFCNSGPPNTSDLTGITASNYPDLSTILTFHTAIPASNANKLSSIDTLGVGTYYVAFYDTIRDCYSGEGLATTAVDVSIDGCDTDGDGVLNINDIDDDNDGILDVDDGCISGTSASDPFTSLGMARNVTSAGTYFFDLNGTTFSTQVDENGYVMVAIDFGNGTGSLPQGTALTTSTRGILNATVLAEFTDINQLRISHSGGNFDVTSTNSTLLSRIAANTTLHQGSADNTINDDWVGTEATAITVNASCVSSNGSSLHQNVIHICGNVAGTHWVPVANAQAIRYSVGSFAGEIGNSENLFLWVQAPLENGGKIDSDQDGINDYLDLDADNDGILDIIEAKGVDLDGDGRVDDDTDTDGDGFADVFDTDDGGTLLALSDTDLDGMKDFVDLDSDNDGILDIIEINGIDLDGDGRVDNDTDTDGDGFADVFDIDDGGTLLPLVDTDLDGIQDHLDLDSDQDGIVDLIEAGGIDSNGDGRLDNNTDSDEDGIADSIDPDNGGTALVVPDSDGDGLFDYLDLDSDNDGLLDIREAQTTISYATPLNLDTDGDGIDNRYDINNGGAAIVLSNNDGDGQADYLDNDSDGDSFPDWHEGFDDDLDGDVLNDLLARASTFEANNGNPLYYVNQDDADADGKPDWLEDDDSDNVPNFLDPDHGNYQDTDNDGLVDLYDSDNGGLSTNLPDGDTDGEYDFRDMDNQISLPITLVSFKATRQGEMVQLEWTTSSEINNESFTIERANENMIFIPILKQSGAGNSNSRLDYVRMDENPMKGYNYYRLRQRDYNGEGEVFHIEAVYFEGHDKMKTYPNPTNGENLFVDLNGIEEGNYQLEILSSEAKLMISREIFISAEQERVRLNLLENQILPKGTYYLRLRGAKSLIRSMVIVK